MEADSARPIEDLLGHRGWVLALARSLVADPSAAEDVAQETWLAAVRRPPEPGRSPRPWLAKVVRNFAVERLRSDASRTGRERGVARERGELAGGGLPPTDDLLSQLETQRILAEVLGALDEPYRTTLLLRYFEELSSAEIARREGVPPGTVRSRLQRGLELLRGRLDARYGDRRSWGLALGALLGRDAQVAAAATGASALSGVFAMSIAWKITAAAAALVAAGAFLMTRSGGPQGLATAAAPAEPELVAPAGRITAVAVAPPEAPVERAEALLEETPEPGAVEPVAEARATARVEGRAVDELGRPLQGALLRGLDADEDTEQRTGADGLFAFEVELGEEDERMGSFAVSCAGRGTRFPAARLFRDGTTHLGDVVLGPGAWVSGRVLDPRGLPAAGARVIVTDPELPWNPEAARRMGPGLTGPTPEGRTDALGRFRVEGVAAGFVRVWAVAEGTRYTFSEPQQIGAGRAAEGLELELVAMADEDRIAGRVLDPEGRGISAQITYGFEAPGLSGNAVIDAGADGRFEIALPVRGPLDLVASAPGDRWGDVALPGVQPGTLDLVLQFVEAETLAVRVHSANGEPVESYSMTVMGTGDGSYIDGYRTEQHDGGAAEVRVPNVPFTVTAVARGHDVATSAGLDPRALPGRIDLVLEPVPGLRGIVLDGDGEPVSGARVELRKLYTGKEKASLNGFQLLYMGWALAQDVTAADGTFLLTVREDGRYLIQAERDGFPLALSEPRDLSKDVGARGVVVQLLPGGTVEGRVRTDPGAESTGTIVAVNRGDGRPRTMRVGPDGTYRFEGLGAGRWQVVASEKEFDPSIQSTTVSSGIEEVSFEWDCVVRSGETTWQDLDLRSRQTCELTGAVVLGGQPGGKVWGVHLRRLSAGATDSELSSSALDQHGRFALTVPDPGDYEVVLSTPYGDGITKVRHVLKLAYGSNHWELDLETAALSGDNAPTAAENELGLRYIWSDEARGVTWEVYLNGDETGHFELPIVPAGEGRFLTYGPPGDGGRRSWVELLSIDLAPGEARHVAIP